MLMVASTQDDDFTPAGFSASVVASTAPVLRLHGPDDAQRLEVETFIARIYAQRYGAVVSTFAPVLVSLQDAGSGIIVAAAGYRNAQQAPLFLERYLAAPVESLLSAHSKTILARRDIVEIGHLAADRAGEGRRLILLLAPLLAGQGFSWVVSTLTQELRLLFVRLGIAPIALAAADPAALDNNAGQWGSYYAHDPVVLAGDLQHAMRQLALRQNRHNNKAGA